MASFQLPAQKSVWNFDPRIVPGCILWLDAADTSRFTLNGSNVLTAIQDKSVLNNTMTTTTTGASSAGYVWNATNFNSSYPAFFTNSGLQNCNIGATSSLSAYATPMTMFVVGRYDGASGTGNQFLFDSPNRISMNGPITANSVTNGLATGTATGTTITETFPSGNFINSVVMNGASSVLYTNGTSSASGTLGTGVTFGTGTVTIGSRFTNISAWYGAICEVLFFSYALGTTERQQVEGYLAWKWGLQASLATGHPYKNNLTVVRPFLRQFQPVDVSTPCLLWFDGADASTVTGTTTVTAWNDKSGNANHITSFSATAPSYSSSTGLLTFSGGTGTTSSVVNFTSASAWTIFVAAVLTSSFPDNGSVEIFRVLSHSSPLWVANISRGIYCTFITSATISGSNTVYNMASTASFTAGNTVTISGITGGTFTGFNGTGTVQSVVTGVSVTVNIVSTGTPTTYTSAIMFRSGGGGLADYSTDLGGGSGPSAVFASSQSFNAFNGATLICSFGQTSATPSYVMTVNGNSPTQTSPAAASTLTSGKNITIGTTFNGVSHRLGEVLFYDGTLSTQDRQKVEGYLIWKWGAQRSAYVGASTNITSAHPFYKFPSASTTPFDPRILGSNLGLWLDAADSTTLTLSGSNISQWNDKSGNSRHMSQTTAINQPTILTNALNSLPVVVLANVSTSNFMSSLAGFAVNGLTNMSIFIVASNTTDFGLGDSTQKPLIWWNESAGWGQVAVGFSKTNYRWRFGTGQASNNPNANFPSSIGSSYILTDVVKSGVTETAYYNGSTLSTVTVTNTTIANTSGGIFYLGYGQGATYGPYNVAEILVITGGLTTQQRQQTEGYLAWKWGLQTSLPTTHPYKKVSP